ncbi:MAG TPA: bifunctional serine/threonine-protein kinase/formylglycine-generating enzyme family protein [Planctomycetota bacterium]|nr:bifunctional serine/threonine-protein kinase/formylglycine-generating enzyme family protein [Planctomycetota bacterium]
MKSDDEMSRFFAERLASPMAYLRGLARDTGPPDAELEEEETLRPPGPSPPAAGEDVLRTSGGEAVPSIIKKVERYLGFAPMRDLSSPHDDGASSFQLSEERYSVEGEIGSGGMGRVLNVFDQDLRRRVAMKVLREDVRGPRRVARFFEEAQATGQLEHPNIAPVYDIGIDRQLGIYFTMKLVRGRNLREVLRDVSIGRLETRRHFTVVRLIQILQQITMGIHYAHVRGVIHRDLKPDNIMVGDFGEVLVMDWGLAKIIDRRLEPELDEPVNSTRRDMGEETLDGTVSGTPGYMAPEQARGWTDAIDARTDIFGLGAILYEILTYHPPHEAATSRETLVKAAACEVVLPHVRSPRNSIPSVLEEICMKALSAEREARFQDAMAFHEALQVFLDGTLEAGRRKEEAARLGHEGREKAREYRRLAEVETKLRRLAAGELAALKPHEPPARKSAAWSLEEEAALVRQKRIESFNDATALLHSAINIDAGSSVAREVLAEIYRMRLEEAERAGNADDQIIYRGLVERYDDGKLAQLLEGKGLLRLDTDPPGATVRIHRVLERERRLATEEECVAGKTPLQLELSMGHYLLVLEKEGYRDTRFPVLMGRSARQSARVRLYKDEEIGEGFIYVPGGEFTMGGDSAASGSWSLTSRSVLDVFVGELPVTFRSYCELLDAMRERGDPDLAAWLPRTEREGECVRIGEAGRFEPAVERIDIDAATRSRHADGFEWNLPIFGVSWHAARKYTSWLSERTGRVVRLLGDDEWEKAARGVARTIHPWGNRFDWSFVKGGLSRAERAQPEPVGTFEHDVSIYGVRDLAGSVIEWCEDWFLEGKYRLTRGGGWYSIHEVAFRAAFRLGTNPANRSSLIGFRVAAEPQGLFP